jgi:hypothetical protein
MRVVSILEPSLDAERTEIIDWLSPMNFFLRHADISQARQQGTGRWLLMEPHFQEWEFDSGRTLWCHGIRVLVSMSSMPGANPAKISSWRREDCPCVSSLSIPLHKLITLTLDHWLLNTSVQHSRTKILE